MGNNENTNGTGNWLNPQRVRMILGILLVALILYVAWQNRETLFSGTDSTIGAETGTTELSVPSGDPSAASVKPTTATTAPTEKPTRAGDTVRLGLEHLKDEAALSWENLY